MKFLQSNLRNRGGFTLIELLVVISIIALLATMGVAGGQIVIKKARALQAQSVMKGLEIAIKGYKTEYLRLPTSQSTAITEDNEAYDTTDESGRGLINVLLATEPTRNPRLIKFWEPPAMKASGAGYSPEEGLRDPWGKLGFKIVLDYSSDGKIANPYIGNGEPEQIASDVILYCGGANMQFDESSEGTKKNDDVKSWQ